MTSIYCQTLDESIGQPKSMDSYNINNTADDFVLSLINGNEIAFQNIWNRFHLPVSKFIYNMCGSYELTEELAQETFVRVFKGISQYRRETKFSSWVFGIAKNVVLENARQTSKRKRNVEVEQAEILAIPVEKQSPERSVLEAEMFSAVYKALDKIEPEQRISFVLRVFQSKSHSEIAEITGYSIAKVKIDIYRIRIKLRKQLSSFREITDELSKIQ